MKLDSIEMTARPDSPKAEAPTMDEQMKYARLMASIMDSDEARAILASLTRLRRAIEQAAGMPERPAAWADYMNTARYADEIEQYIDAIRAHCQHLAARIADCQTIAHDWGQGVTDAEAAIRKLHRLFPIDQAAGGE